MLFDPPHAWGVGGIDGPIRAAVNVTNDLLDGNERSRGTITIDITGHGLGKLLVLLVTGQARKEMPASVQRLEQRLEGFEHRAGVSPPKRHPAPHPPSS